MRHLLLVTIMAVLPSLSFAQALPGTQPLESKDDLAKQMVEGIDRYLTRLTGEVAAERRAGWKLDHSSAEAHEKSLQPKRERLKKLLGVVDERVPVTTL